MKELREIRNSNILLDANILIHYAAEGFAERSGNILRILHQNKNLLTVSHITAFELLNCDPKDRRREKYLKFVNGVRNHPVNQAIFQNAAVLSNECKRLARSYNRIFPIPDLILGATILFYPNDTVYLLTTDRNDFFDPLWELVAHQQILKEENEAVEADLYLLTLNREVLLPQYRKAEIRH
ncbi:MAG: hypothetical protein UY50_C0009G0027 [Parcubacteria group bacterium GW2011_GWA2_49_9]|nr:MAG: hypothetical protein UY50_C0009G0027 [Parcubacteria group bacterium GW2011_GWA2_49_9]